MRDEPIDTSSGSGSASLTEDIEQAYRCLRIGRDGRGGCLKRPGHVGACKRARASSTQHESSSLDEANPKLASEVKVDATCQVSFETVINVADAVVNGYGSPETVDSIPDFESFYLSLVEKRGDKYFCPCGYSYKRTDWQSHGMPTHMWKGKRGHCIACVERFNAANLPLDGTASVVQLQKMVEAQRGVIRSLQDEKAAIFEDELTALRAENAKLRKAKRSQCTVTNHITNNIAINLPPYAIIGTGNAMERQKAPRLDENNTKIRGIMKELDQESQEPKDVIPWYIMEKYFADEPNSNFRMTNRSKMEVAEAVVEDEHGQRSWKPIDGKAAVSEFIKEGVTDMSHLKYDTLQYHNWRKYVMHKLVNLDEGGYNPKRVYNTEHCDHKYMMGILHQLILGIPRP